jgi:hypothetical protein
VTDVAAIAALDQEVAQAVSKKPRMRRNSADERIFDENDPVRLVEELPWPEFTWLICGCWDRTSEIAEALVSVPQLHHNLPRAVFGQRYTQWRLRLP